MKSGHKITNFLLEQNCHVVGKEQTEDTKNSTALPAVGTCRDAELWLSQLNPKQAKETTRQNFGLLGFLLTVLSLSSLLEGEKNPLGICKWLRFSATKGLS